MREQQNEQISEFLRRVMPTVHQALNEDENGDALS